MDWMDKVYQLAHTDGWYQECLEDLKRRTPAYEEVLRSLTESQREALEAYIAACEELEHALLPIAYHLGYREGIRKM